MAIVGAQTSRVIAREAGELTPSIVEELKEDMLEDIADELLTLIQAYGLVRWHINSEERRIEARVDISVVEQV